MSRTPLVIERHVRRRMALYHITADEVTRILETPALRRPNKAGQGCQEAWGQAGERWFMVVYRPEGDRIVLVTVETKRRGPA
ncbi:MAG: DUF4258 domain-containing protein [Chloroflexi bacterium]|nr:DUF4258 domain-containing protein [Chloroflexota bacterium]